MALTRDDLLTQARANLNIITRDNVPALVNDGATVLDIREPGEFNMGHLPGAVHIPRGLLEFMVGNHAALLDPKKALVVYCKNGGRSTLAADLLQRMGFENITMLEQGFDGWQDAKNEIEIPSNQYDS
jgi:rhodanese-related sulfurtransferase